MEGGREERKRDGGKEGKRERGTEGGRERKRDGGREGKRERKREGGRERGMEGGRERERERGMDGGRDGGREGKRERKRMDGGRDGGREGKRERERERATLLVGLNQEVGDSWVTGLQSHGEGVACFLGVTNIKGLKGKVDDQNSIHWKSELSCKAYPIAKLSL